MDQPSFLKNYEVTEDGFYILRLTKKQFMYIDDRLAADERTRAKARAKMEAYREKLKNESKEELQNRGRGRVRIQNPFVE